MTTIRYRRFFQMATSVAAITSLGAGVGTAHATPVGLGLSSPDALARVGTNLWVANSTSNSLSEVDANGTLLRRVAGAKFHFSTPDALVSVGTKLFVASAHGAVTEIDANSGALVRLLNAPKYHISNPVALVVSWPDLWILNRANSTVTEVSVTTGTLVRILTNTKADPSRISHPNAAVVAAGNLWITNTTSNSLSEFSTRTGAFIRTISAAAFALASPAGVSFDGTHLWVSESASNSVTEITAATGALVQVITNSSLSGGYGFMEPSTTIAWSHYVYVVSPPGASPMVTQIEDSTGVANWMMCNTNYAFDFANPSALLIDGSNLWVASAANNALVEMNATTGVLVNRFT